VRSRARYALTAAAISAVLFLVLGLALADDGAAAQVGGEDANPLSLVMLVPVVILLLVAFWKRDIFLATTVGLLTGIVVGLVAGLMGPADIISANDDGTAGGFLVAGVADILPLIGLGIVVFSIIGIFQGAGIFDRIVDAAARSRLTNTPRGTELVIGLGAALTAGIFAGVNGPSMIMYGPLADRIGSRVGLHPYRRANVMDCFTLGIGSVVPVVSSFLLIAGLLTQGYGEGIPEQSPVAIFTTAFYPLVLTVVILVAVLTGWGRRFEGEDGAETKEPQPAALP
jgi:Na+/H+ antiporter NhaC